MSFQRTLFIPWQQILCYDACKYRKQSNLKDKLRIDWSQGKQKKNALKLHSVISYRGMMENKLNSKDNNSYENVKTFKYLGSLLTNQNVIHKEIKCRLKAENSCYYPVQILSSSRHLSKNLKIKIYLGYKTIICQLCHLVVKYDLFHYERNLG
jgi:hypothetical protein